MLRALYSAVSGLRSHQTMLDTIGNNIANVNTTGYKASQTIFEDTLSEALRSAGGPQATAGGSNPAQVGLGVRVGAISTNFGQGATQVTGRATDVALSGDGFFTVQQGGQTMYSRAGSFDFDGRGRLVNPDGALVLGWTANGGQINTNSAVGPLTLPIGQSVAPSQTTSVQIGGNLSADSADGATWVSPIDLFDAKGTAIKATATYTKTGPDAWRVDVSVPNTTGTAVNVGSTALTWNNATGSFAGASLTLTQAALNGAGYTFASGIQVSTGGTSTPLTQYAGANDATATQKGGQAMGTLQSFSIDDKGVLVGLFSNGVRQDLGQLAVANFANPPGLEKAGGSLYRSTANSGAAAIGAAGTAGRGTLVSGALEMSNVDLAQEFSNLIVAQRGFEANSRVVSASDEILQDLVNMKH